MKFARNRNIVLSTVLSLLGATFCGGTVGAQQPAGAGTNSTKQLPDSPQPKDNDSVSPPMAATGAIIGYMTNRSIAFPDIAHTGVPLSSGGKFKLFVNQSISPPYLLGAGVSAAISQARDVPAAYGQGWDAYGSRYGATLARASSSSFFGTFAFASLLHQDPRFFPEVHPTLWGSVKYSAKRILVTRKDNGKDTFNTSGLLGPLAAEALANVYLPRSEQTGAKNAERYGTDLAWRFAANMFKNYWPTLFRDMGLNRLKVIPDPNSTQH
jgi:hypothetical protein